MVYRVLVLFVAFFALNAGAAPQATQKSSVAGVTVVVTPGNLAAKSKVWDFAVILDTHSQELSDDLVKEAVLADDKGNEYRAIEWEGAAPGGHHRKGVLKFNGIEPSPRAVELRIQRSGETTPRKFRWDLK